MKNVYALQPYEVGSKNRKSLAIVIPAKIVRKYRIDTSTVFVLNGNENGRKLILQTVQALEQSLVDSSASLEHPLESRNP